MEIWQVLRQLVVAETVANSEAEEEVQLATTPKV